MTSNKNHQDPPQPDYDLEEAYPVQEKELSKPNPKVFSENNVYGV